MRAEILCVGTELLLGQIVDTNAAYIASQLARAGIDVLRKQTAGDNLERIADCIGGAQQRAEVLIITGGLGPTTDDLTREAIALSHQVDLVHHSELEDNLRAYFERRGLVPSPTTMRQALLPQGASAIANPVGTAPGVLLASPEGRFIFAVPGVPREMRVMVDETIIPFLLERLEGQRQIIVSRVLRAFGVGESTLAEPIEDILTTSQNPTVAPLIFNNTEVHLRLTAKVRDESAAHELLDDMEAKIRARVGEHIFGTNEQTLPAVVLQLLQERGMTLSIAESVTGGLLHAMFTDVPGASAVIQGGVVAYDAAVKEKVLSVPAPLIAQHSVVSGEVAVAMAEGVRRKLNTHLALSTTGEAGPQAATNAPTGTVWIGLCDGSNSHAYHRQYFGDRDAVRRRSALAAVDVLRRHLLGLPIAS